MGEFIGEYVEIDVKSVMRGLAGVLRVRVKVDVRKPLKRKKCITLPNGAFFM